MKPIQITDPGKEEDRYLKDRMSKILHKTIVMSGKEGVGKTSVSANLAYALARGGREMSKKE
jgi:Mrp family chromosome partitioning ATPase